MAIPDRCKDVTSRKLIKVAENGRSFSIRNVARRHITLVKVDGCAITTGERCDFMFLADRGKELFVELKGSDIKKALSQITRSIGELTQIAEKSNRTAVIVSSRVPAEDTGTMNAKAKLVGHFVSRLYVKNGSLEVEADLVV